MGDKTYTYRDFSALLESQDWMSESAEIVCAELTPDELLDLLTDTRSDPTDQPVPDAYGPMSAVYAAALGTWSVAVSMFSLRASATLDEYLPADAQPTVVAFGENINSDAHFTVWRGSYQVADFDPLCMSDFGVNSDGEWEKWMLAAGVDPQADGPQPDGEYHVLDTCFAMLANLTGVVVTPEFFDNPSRFITGFDAEWEATLG